MNDLATSGVENTDQSVADSPFVIDTPLTEAVTELPEMPAHIQKQPPLVLAILDGWGIAPPSRANAISMAATPHINELMHEYPTVPLYASGEEVGLPYNEMGNSEVGHLNIGAGKIVYQNLPRIDKAISTGTFYDNAVFVKALQEAKERGAAIHLMGLASFGGIHSSQEHLYALLELCKRHEMTEKVFVHAFLDGRDTSRNAALASIAQLETKMDDLGVGSIATIGGRFWGMDRDNRWERIEVAYNAIAHGVSEHVSPSPLKAIEDGYEDKMFDEEFVPTVITNDAGEPRAKVQDKDVVFFFNFRSDRARQITKAFVLPGFTKFDRGDAPTDLIFVTMTEYERNLPVRVAYTQDDVEFPLARILSDAGLTQLHIAETEKYAHVTFFLNGGAEEPFQGEERQLVPSPRIKSYDEQPEMATPQISEKVVAALQLKKYDVIILNFANPDMVAHTGNLQAAMKAVESVDAAIGAISAEVFAQNGTLLITADHGNVESMLDLATGEIVKEHTKNAVPCILANAELKTQRTMWPPVDAGDVSRLQPVGVLSDIAPTVLTLLHVPIPKQMTGRSLVRVA